MSFTNAISSHRLSREDRLAKESRLAASTRLRSAAYRALPLRKRLLVHGGRMLFCSPFLAAFAFLIASGLGVVVSVVLTVMFIVVTFFMEEVPPPA